MPRGCVPIPIGIVLRVVMRILVVRPVGLYCYYGGW